MSSVGHRAAVPVAGRLAPWWRMATRAGSTGSSATRRIVRLVICALVAIVLLVVVGATAMALLRHQLVTLADRIEPQTHLNRELEQSLTVARDQARDYQLTGVAGFADAYRTARPELGRRLDAFVPAFAGDPELAEVAAAEHRAAVAWLTRFGDPAVAGPGSEDRTAASAAAFERVVALNDRLEDLLQRRTVDLVASSTALLAGGIVAIAAIAVLGTLLVLWPGLAALRSIGPPLQSLYATAQAQRSGRLAARADPEHGVAEIRAVASAFNDLADNNERNQARLAADLANTQFVARLSRQVNHTLDLDAVITPSLPPIADWFGAAAAWIRVWDGTADVPGEGIVGFHPPEAAPSSPLVLINTARHVATLAWLRETCHVIDPDVPPDRDYLAPGEHQALVGHLQHLGHRSVVIAPLGSGHDVLGYLALARPPDRRWSAEDVDALHRIGQVLGQAIVHARVFRREQQLVAELQELDARKQNFVSMVSHELRTPLAAIVGHLELVQGGDLGEVAPTFERSLSAMSRNSARLGRLIEDLLVISRVEGSDESSHRLVDLCELAGDVCQMHENRAASGEVAIRLHTAGQVEVTGNDQELERVISNLLGNAIKFSPPGSRIDVQVGQVGDDAVLCVRDQGLGISEADQRQLFDRFFRASNALASGIPGTGLGLAITKQIVTKHRGTIAVSSEVGRGSTFTVTLPRDFRHVRPPAD